MPLRPHSSMSSGGSNGDWAAHPHRPMSQAHSAGDIYQNTRHGARSRLSSVDSSSNSQHGLHKSESYRGQTQAWWSVDEHMKPRGVLMSSHQQMGMSLAARIFQQSEESWDLSDSLADLYLEHDIISKKSWSSLATFKPPSNLDDIDKDKWIAADTSHGFIRVYPPDSTAVAEVGARVIPCSLAMEAHSICQAIGVAPNSLHVQFGGDMIRRLDPYEHPLVLQNEYLSKIGYHDVYRIQLEGLSVELGYLIRFFSGKPFFDNTFSRNHLSAYLDVKLGGVLSRWCKRLCTLSGTQLKIYKDKSENGTAQVIQLSNGGVEECKSKTHPHYLKLTTQSSGPEKVIFLSYDTFTDYSKWLKKCKKAVAKLPSNADLSNCNLEFLPETLFINGQLSMLNLRHNALKHRPTEEDIYTIGWLDDLPSFQAPKERFMNEYTWANGCFINACYEILQDDFWSSIRFQCLRSLNLADNNLEAFPKSICEMTGLVELNLGCNKIDSIPTTIGDLANLQALHLHNNHLSGMPDEIMQLKKLVILVLAFNKFHQIPASVAQLTDVRTSECETIIMAGNLIETISSEVFTKLKHAKKVDLRMNNLSLQASETLQMSMMEQLTHLDLRMNNIRELDLRNVKSLEYLNVERNDLHSLQLNGTQLKTVFAAYNGIQQFLVNPKPEWLELIDLSYNKLENLPEWISDCGFLKRLNVSHNKLQSLPQRIFCDAQKLKQLIADHNEIRELPPHISNSVVEEINLHHNLIESLPEDFLCSLNKLKILNLSSNALTVLPPLNEIDDLNKLHELYLTQNSLHDDCIDVISGYHRLKILHLAYNELTHIEEKFVESLELLQELNLSGNRMRSLPANLVNMPELRLLRAHSNLLKTLPDLTESSSLKVLDVACNKLLSISASELASSSQLHSLDMQMTHFSIDRNQMEVAKKTKQIKSIDSSGENKDLSTSDLSNGGSYKIQRICQIGFAESSGSRNKLCVSVIHHMTFKEQDEALFAMFDGGRNSEVPKILKKVFPDIVSDEISKSDKPNIYLKYAFLQAHKSLKNTGQYLGSSGLVCHIRRNEDSNRRFYINIASCGDIAAVLCRAGEAMLLTQAHTVVDDREEASRIFRSDGIITEDNRVNGASTTSRSLGNCYLYPQLIPEPNIIKKTLRPEDQFLIIANSSLWRFLSHKEAVEEVQYIANPVVAAKRLQDLAQGYGCKENVSVLVVQFNNNALSAAPSMMSINSSEPVFHTLPNNKDKTLSKVNKRPIPAPRSSNSSKNGDSNLSLASRDSVDLSYINIPERWEEGEDGDDLEESLRRRLSQVKEKEIRNFLQSMEGHNGPRKPRRSHTLDSQSTLGSQSTVQDSRQSLTDSNSTLTDGIEQSVDELNSFDKHQAKLPLYSSDTRLMEFIDSTSTLNSDSGTQSAGRAGRQLSYPREPHHQSDTRLLHSSQIELKSTNYFNRPPLSCSSLEEETDEDYEDYLLTAHNDGYSVYSSQASEDNGRQGKTGHYSVYSSSSTNGLMRPVSRLMKPASRRKEIDISGHSINESPDGSYFSIDSSEADEDGDIYENVAALKARNNMLSHSRPQSRPQPHIHPYTHQQSQPPNSQSSSRSNSRPNSRPNSRAGTHMNGQSNSSLTRKGTFYQNYDRERALIDNERAMLSGDFDFDIPQMSSKISLLQYDEPDIVVNSQVLRENNSRYRPTIKQKPLITNNNTHHISNGSSAYGSGSMSTSSDSNLHTYL